jgi:hypothetical protein
MSITLIGHRVVIIMGGNGPLLVSRLLIQIGKLDNPMAIHLQDTAPILILALPILTADIGLTIPALPCSG